MISRENDIVEQNGANGEQTAVSPAGGQAVYDYFGTDEIFQRVAASADEELSLSLRLIFFSGLAAGLSIGLSFIARAAITGHLPQDESGLIANILYPIGFILIVLGRYQLFTENTLTPVTLVLTRLASLPTLLRHWGVVLAANILGATVVAFMFANSAILETEAMEAAVSFGEHALEYRFSTLFMKGIIAGWLVASMVWLTHAARDTISRFFIVLFIMFLIPSMDLFHCVVGACEVLFLFFLGEATLAAATGFFLPVLLGNTVGGVLLVGILNYAQTENNRFPDRDCDALHLTWRQWLTEFHTGS